MVHRMEAVSMLLPGRFLGDDWPAAENPTAKHCWRVMTNKNIMYRHTFVSIAVCLRTLVQYSAKPDDDAQQRAGYIRDMMVAACFGPSATSTGSVTF